MDLLSNLRLGFSGALRTLDSGRVFTTKLGQVLIEFVKGNRRPELAVRIREAFEELGATYIKLGQFIASAPSLFPEEFTEEMEKCLDSVRPLPFWEVRKVVESELGGSLSDYFQSFEQTPIASASIAQVHGAITKSGFDVVVKVQRPDIESTLQTDMSLIYLIAVILSKVDSAFSSSGLLDIVKAFHDSILQETNFLQEAKNIEEFEEYLISSSETRAKVPRVFHEYTTKRILTMERLYGVPLTNLDAIRKYSSNPQETLLYALNVWFSSLASTGMFHADVHAGNLLLLRDGKIGFIDFGIVGRISKDTWKGLMLFMNGIGIADATMMAKGLVLMDSTAKGIDEKQFAKDLDRVLKEMEEISQQLQGQNISRVDEEKLNRIMFDIADISKRNGLKIPREFGLLIKQMLYFDRYVKILAPEIDLIRDQQKYLPK